MLNDSRRVSVLLGLLFGTTGLANASAALALGPVADHFDVSPGVASWVVSLYVLMLGVATALYGRLADLFGQRWPLGVGVLLLAAGSVAAAVAPTFPLLVAARVVQGLGAAAVPTLGMAVVSTRYVGDARARGMVTLASVGVASGSLGPLLVGAVLDVGGWRWTMVLPALGLVLLVPVWGALSTERSAAVLDVPGAVLVAVATGGVVLMISSPSTGTTALVIGLGLAGMGAPALIAWVRRRPDGFLPRVVVTNRTVIGSALAASCMPVAWFALLVAIPLVLADDGWTPFQIGLAFVPGALSGLVAQRPMAALGRRLGSRWSLVVGVTVAAVTLLVAAVGCQLSVSALLVCSGVGITAAFSIGQPAMVDLVASHVEPSARGVALGVATLIFMVGGSLGSAFLGGVGPQVGTAGALLALAGVAAIGALGAMALVRATRDGTGDLGQAAVAPAAVMPVMPVTAQQTRREQG